MRSPIVVTVCFVGEVSDAVSVALGGFSFGVENEVSIFFAGSSWAKGFGSAARAAALKGW